MRNYFLILALALSTCLQASLIDVVRQQDAQALQAALAGGVDVNEKNEHGVSALDWICYKHKADLLRVLLTRPDLTGVDEALRVFLFEFTWAEPDDDLPALRACINAIFEMRQDLDVNGKRDGEPLIVLVAETGDQAFLKTLLAYKAEEPLDINVATGKGSALAFAVANYDESLAGQQEQMLDILLADSRFDPTKEQSYKGLPCWDLAIIGKKISVLKKLHECGYRKHTGSFESDLMLALRLPSEEVALALLQLDPTLASSQNAAGLTPLVSAINQDMPHLVEAILQQDSLPWNAATRKLGDTALIAALKKRQFPVALHLMEKKGCDVNQADHFGVTPLMWAARMRSVSCMQALLERGAKTDAVSQDGSTASSIAQKLDADCAKLLEKDVVDPAPAVPLTVFVYGCGADLESNGQYLTSVLGDMQDAYLDPSQVRLVVLYGGSRVTGERSLGDVYTFENDQEIKIHAFGACDMGHPNTLRDFLQWGMRQHPAERYGLVLWDHGGGPAYGVCEDENTQNMISLSNLRQALCSVCEPLTMKFDFIALDACFMASVETIMALSDVTQYVWASQEIVPECGLYYKPWLEVLNKQPSLNNLELGKLAIDQFKQWCQYLDKGNDITFSIVEIAKMPILLAELNAYLEKVDAAVDLPNLVGALAKAKGYFAEQDRGLFDLRSLLNELEKMTGQAVPQALLQALEDAVVAKVASENNTFACGLSLFVPLPPTDPQLRALYLQCIDNCMPGAWAQIVRKFSHVLNWPLCEIKPIFLADDVGLVTLQVSEEQGRHLEAELPFSENFSFETNADTIASIRYTVEYPTEDGKGIYVSHAENIYIHDFSGGYAEQGGFRLEPKWDAVLLVERTEEEPRDCAVYAEFYKDGVYVYGQLDGVDGRLKLPDEGPCSFWRCSADAPFTPVTVDRPAVVKEGQKFRPRRPGSYHPDGRLVADYVLEEALGFPFAIEMNKANQSTTQLRITVKDLLGRTAEPVLLKMKSTKPLVQSDS